MAAIHQLISQVPDTALRERLQEEADALTIRRRHEVLGLSDGDLAQCCFGRPFSSHKARW